MRLKARPRAKPGARQRRKGERGVQTKREALRWRTGTGKGKWGLPTNRKPYPAEMEHLRENGDPRKPKTLPCCNGTLTGKRGSLQTENPTLLRWHSYGIGGASCRPRPYLTVAASLITTKTPPTLISTRPPSPPLYCYPTPLPSSQPIV